MHATVRDLNPWVDYEFRVVAINRVGMGEPSTPSKHVRTRAAGILPLCCSSFAKTVESVLLAKTAIQLLFSASSLLNLSLAFFLIFFRLLCTNAVLTVNLELRQVDFFFLFLIPNFNSFYSVIQRNCDATTSANRQQIKVSIWSSLAG